MKILIVLGNISPSDDANTNIARLIAQEMKGQGHAVAMLGTSFQVAAQEEMVDGIQYYRILRLESNRQKEISLEWQSKHSRKEQILFVIKHPLFFSKLLFRYIKNRFYDSTERKYIKALRRVAKIEKPHRVVVITSPFYVATAVEKALKNIELIWYQLDPNQSNATEAYKGKKDLLSKEISLYNRVKFAVVPRLIYEENKQNALSKFLPKMRAADFPNVRKMELTDTQDNITFDTQKINVVFVGTFYEDIRSPLPFFDIIEQSKDPRLMFHVVGGGCLDLLNKQAENFKDKFIYHGYRSLATSVNAMLSADILVNVDNLAKNMLPSKLNDYISACRPIINLHPYPDSESIKYLNRHPVCLHVCTQEGLKSATVNEIEIFCIKNASTCLSFEDVIEKYATSTPAYVTKMLLSEI